MNPRRFNFALIVFFLVAPNSVLAVDCAPVDIDLTTQSDVDNFQVNHGPCDRVAGNLRITNLTSPTANLVGLSGITEIGRDVTIRQNLGLQDLDGLEGLQTIGGHLDIDLNGNLVSIGALSNISSVGDGIYIDANHSLRDLDGFPAIAHLERDGYLTIRNNWVLQNIDGLSGMTSFIGELVIHSNCQITDIDGLSNLTEAAGWLRISNNCSLTNLDGLSGLTETNTRLTIAENFELVDIDGLSGLTSAYRVSVLGNTSLSDCSPLRRVLDVVDHGDSGPGPPADEQPIPDVFSGANVSGNGEGCKSIEDIAPRPDPVVAITGSWFNAESAGEGFMIHAVEDDVMNPFVHREGLAIGYFYGFDPDGRRFWLIGVNEGPLEWGDEIRFDAASTSGGRFEDYDPAAVAESDWGEFTFVLNTCDSGVIVLGGTFEGELATRHKTLPVRRLGKVAGSYCAQQVWTAPEDSITASWWDPATPGQGFAFHKINADSGIIYFYGFTANGERLWLIGVWDEPLVLGRDISLGMNQVSGGTFSLVDPANIVESTWGTLELHLNDCDSGVARLEGVNGTQVFNLEQLAGTVGLECE